MVYRPEARKALAFVLATLVATAAGAASEPNHPWCGTTRGLVQEKVAVHEEHVRRQEEKAREGALIAASHSGPEASQVGNIAVLVDDGSLIVEPNPLDLDGLGVQYARAKKNTYRASPYAGGFSDDLGKRLALGDDDSVLVRFPKKKHKRFRFPFYGTEYDRMYVHSDGNISFVRADAASTARSLPRLLGGPPRIAGFFADLDPSATTAEGAGVYARVTKERAVVTWIDVPTFGADDRNTVQVTLFPDGRITVAYGELGETSQSVVGISPGDGARVKLVDFAGGLPTSRVKLQFAIAERFQSEREVDDLAIGQAFFREFADDYDHLIVWFDFFHSLGPDAFAYEFTLKNEIEGIGEGIFDHSAAAGSDGRLRSFVQMGSLSRYPANPRETFLGTNSTLDVLGQETGHRWGAYLRFIDDNGATSNALLGRAESHWSFCHDTSASDLEGNQITDNGGGRFSTVAATERFSMLDQYMMGLVRPEDVPRFFYVAGCPFEPGLAPQVGVNFNGTRVDVGIDQVVAAEGPRVPSASDAPHEFKMAFILVSRGGSFPSTESIAKVENIRGEWERYFVEAVEGRGSVDATLRRK